MMNSIELVEQGQAGIREKAKKNTLECFTNHLERFLSSIMVKQVFLKREKMNIKIALAEVL